MLKYIILIGTLMTALMCWSQSASDSITLRGKVYDQSEFYVHDGSLFIIEQNDHGVYILQKTLTDSTFWLDNNSTRYLYLRGKGKIARSSILLPMVGLTGAFFGLGFGAQGIIENDPAIAIPCLAACAGFLVFTPILISKGIKKGRSMKDEALRRRLGEASEPQSHVRLVGSGQGIGISFQF